MGERFRVIVPIGGKDAVSVAEFPAYVAGLLPFDSGTITLGGRDLSALPARKRGFGIVFQSYSLFPNMTVAENVGYGLRIRGESRERIDARVRELLALIKLCLLYTSRCV